jgi:hypothetical protein
VSGFAKAFAGRWRIVEMDIRLRLRKRLRISLMVSNDFTRW